MPQIPSGHPCHRNLYPLLFCLTIFVLTSFHHVSCTQYTSTLHLSNTATTSLDFPVMVPTLQDPNLMCWGPCGTSSALPSSMGFPPWMLLSGSPSWVLTRGDGDPHVILWAVPCPCFLTAILSALRLEIFMARCSSWCQPFLSREDPKPLPKKALPTRQQVTCHSE